MIEVMLADEAPSVTAAAKNRVCVQEPKLDGVRLLAHIQGGAVTFYTRAGHAHAGVKFPLIREELTAVPDDTILDAELWSPFGFGVAQGALQTVDPQEAARKAADGELILYTFDLLRMGGNDTRSLSLEARRGYLERLGKRMEWKQGAVRVIPQHAVSEATYEAYLEAGFEGAMVKALSARYSGGRGRAMIKVKPILSDEFVVQRFEEGSGSWSGGIGKIVFGRTKDGPRVGSVRPKTDAMKEELEADPDSFIGRPLEVLFQEITEDGALRFARFRRWRDDKTAEEIANV